MATRGFSGKRPPTDVAARLPPGQSLTQDFPVLSAGPTPQVPFDQWEFTNVTQKHWSTMRALEAVTVSESDREYHWPPSDNPGLSELGF